LEIETAPSEENGFVEKKIINKESEFASVLRETTFSPLSPLQ
jgi:hypothetical protein